MSFSFTQHIDTVEYYYIVWRGIIIIWLARNVQRYKRSWYSINKDDSKQFFICYAITVFIVAATSILLIGFFFCFSVVCYRFVFFRRGVERERMSRDEIVSMKNSGKWVGNSRSLWWRQIHITRHLSFSFSDEVPDAEPGGAEADRLALFFESGCSDMALFLSRLKSSFFRNHIHYFESSLIYLDYVQPITMTTWSSQPP